jgi:hypothetical protein
LSNLNFGKVNPNVTRFDKEVLEGWGVRPYNWSLSAGVQHQLGRGTSIDVGYFRRWYGNFTVTDNLAVGPTDYDPFCVTAPTNDPKLPVAGQQICGFYDIKPALNGVVRNVVRLSDHYGKQSEVYNGVDASVNWRIQGLTLFGGVSIGHTVTNACFTVDSPAFAATATSQAPMANCEVAPPFLQQWKGYGVYSLPWDMNVSGTFQAVPQPQAGGTYNSITADYVATNAEIRPTLNRDLAAGTNGTATVELLKPFTLLGGHTKQFDVRLGKTINAGSKRRVRLSMDVYNLFNSNDWQTLTTRISSNPATNRWQRPTLILQSRYFQFGTQIDF